MMTKELHKLTPGSRTNRLEQLIIGTTLGDGYLTRPNGIGNGHLAILHSKKQEEYLKWKASILEEFGLCAGISERSYVHPYNNRRHNQIQVWSKADKIFAKYRQEIYRSNVKTLDRHLLNKLTPLGLAIWYMDDGHLTYFHSNDSFRLEFNSHNFTLEEHEIMARYFREAVSVKLNIGKNSGKYVLRCGKTEARKLFSLIGEYIHPSLAYKTDFSKREYDPQARHQKHLKQYDPAKRHEDYLRYKERVNTRKALAQSEMKI